jgi:hypothetical protein
MQNPLSGVRIKVDRAKKHLDLEAAIRAFEALGPYAVTMQEDPKTGCEVYQFRQSTAIPSDLGALLGDCVHNLRSALDHLAGILVRAGAGTPGNYTAFPIGADEIHFRSSAIHGLRGAPAAAIKLVRRLKPYKGGNETLWRLHRLDIADKHTLLIPVAAAHDVFIVKSDVRGPGMDHLPPAKRLRGPAIDHKFPLEDGDILGTYRRLRADGYEDKTEFGLALQ